MYFIQEKDDDLAPCKIGITNRLHKRLHALQMGNPKTLQYKEVVFFPSTIVQLSSHDFGFDYYNSKVRVRKAVNKALYDHDYSNYKLVEGGVHKMFKDANRHIRGEWFSGGYEYLLGNVERYLKVNFPDDTYYLSKEMIKRIKLKRVDVGIAADKSA